MLDARTATDHFPGIGRYVSNLLGAMVRQLEASEHLMVLRDATQPSQWKLPPAAGNVHFVQTATSPFSLAQQWRIPLLLHRYHASVYHSPYYLMPYWCPIPALVTFFDFIPKLLPGSVPRLTRISFSLAGKLALRNVRRVVVPSVATRQDLLHYYPSRASRVALIPLAPASHFQPQTEQRMDAPREKYNLPSRYSLYVGINKPHKNLVRLVEAWKLVTAQGGSPMPLILAGNWDPRYPEAKLKAAKLLPAGAVRFLGPVPEADLPGLYSAATAFIFPSCLEGFGLPVVEAMACGTAVACSDVSSLPEVAGSAAVYFDPHDIGEMATQIGRLLADDTLRENCRREGLIRAKQFSWAVTAERTLNIYRQLAKSCEP